MTKQEIISAIDSTIVPNRKKGITAESLANLLREMASATPEGGSGDVEMVKFNLFTALDVDTSQSGIENIINSIKGNFGVDIRDGELHNYLLSCLEENKKSYDYIVENAGKKDFICVAQAGKDLELYTKTVINPLLEAEGKDPYDVVNYYSALPVEVSLEEFAQGSIEFKRLYLSACVEGATIAIEVSEDGSLAIAWTEPSSSSDLVKRIWLDELSAQEISEEHKQENANTVKAVKEGYYGPIVLCTDDLGVRVSYTSSAIEAGEMAPNGYVVSVGVAMTDGTIAISAYEDGSITESIME